MYRAGSGRTIELACERRSVCNGESRVDTASLLAVILCWGVTVSLGLASDGVYHDDDLTHFLIARWACWFPEYLLHIWGRPGLTLPLAAVAWVGEPQIGWHLARLLSASATAAGALIAAHLARRLDFRRPWLVVVACYSQPLNTVLAGTTLTENFAALYLIAAVALLQARQVAAAATVFSVAVVTRHEMIVLLPLLWWAVWTTPMTRGRRCVGLLLALWAPLVHNLLFRYVFGEWPARTLLQPGGSREYVAAGLLTYIPVALQAIPPVLCGLAILGGIILCRRGRFLLPALACGYLATHVALRTLGLYASGGYGRFMVAIAPLVGILAVAGLEHAVRQARERRPSQSVWPLQAGVWMIGLVALEAEQRAGRITFHGSLLPWLLRGAAGVVLCLTLSSWYCSRRRHGAFLRQATAGLLVATCALQCLVLIRPLRPRAEQERIRQMTAWLTDQRLDGEPIFATNPWVAYYLGMIEFPRAHKGPTLLASMPLGTIVIWDSVYSPSDFHGLPLSSLGAGASYEMLNRFADEGPRRLEVRIFRKVAPTPLPCQPDSPYPADLTARRSPVLGTYYIRPGRR